MKGFKMPKVLLKHPVAIRWFHWINFPLLALMVWSGLLIYWAYDIYGFGPIHFFPRWVYATFGMHHKLAKGMAMHFLFMWLFAINGIAYTTYTFVSGEWKYLLPRSLSSFRDAWEVVLYDLGLRKSLPPQEKYNSAQQIAYTGIVVMGVLSLLTGLAIYKPAQLAWLTGCFGGYTSARFLHFWLTMGYILFFVLHVAQVLRAGWNNLRGMISGYELVGEHE